MKKSKFIAIYASVMLLLCTTSACTHNRGDIGHLFGQWKLEKISIDGVNEETYKGNVFWDFESHVIKMQALRNGDSVNSFGSWDQPDDATLVLNFTHNDADNNVGRYTPAWETHFTRAVINLKVDELNSKRMTLTYHAPDGHVYVYYLKKWGW